ncbi:MAG: hypothetical protein M3Y44_17770 [Actinomycetota bacterium]|nr:hypothetical protein [Actinomycetota bacterium]
MIIGLLLIALICLVLGLVLQSSVWLIASLIATGGAGYLLYRLRDVIATPKDRRGDLPSELPHDVAKAAVAPRPDATAVPDEAAESEAADDSTELLDGDATQPAADSDNEVWVIDGRPRYHLGDCAIIKGQDAEPIPYEQATEDGFMPCSLCEPHAARAR